MFAKEYIHYNKHTQYRFVILHLSTLGTAASGGGGDVRDIVLGLGETRNHLFFFRSFFLFNTFLNNLLELLLSRNLSLNSIQLVLTVIYANTLQNT